SPRARLGTVEDPVEPVALENNFDERTRTRSFHFSFAVFADSHVGLLLRGTPSKHEGVTLRFAVKECRGEIAINVRLKRAIGPPRLDRFECSKRCSAPWALSGIADTTPGNLLRVAFDEYTGSSLGDLQSMLRRFR
ncbi:MAG TPA: hypothetical protein VI541_03585, partial [Actinomycetota bacterium]|nr:hypothetical protein [Actinomycetota bacterium]